MDTQRHRHHLPVEVAKYDTRSGIRLDMGSEAMLTGGSNTSTARMTDGRQELRIRRIIFRLRDGWAIDVAGRDGLGGECFPFESKDDRPNIRVSRGDMTEMIKRELIAPERNGLADFVLGPAAERYLRVVRAPATRKPRG